MSMSGSVSTDGFGPFAPFTIVVSSRGDHSSEHVDEFLNHVRGLLSYLRHGAAGYPGFVNVLSDQLAPGEARAQQRRNYQALLREWPGLGQDTPIVVQTDLSPGLGSQVARLVWNEFSGANCRVQAAVPLPLAEYASSSVFDRPDARKTLWQDLVSLLGRSGTPQELQAEAESDVWQRVLQIERGSGDSSPAPGNTTEAPVLMLQWLAMTSHLMVLFTDEAALAHDRMLQTRLNGPRPRELPWISDLPLPHGGPALCWFTDAGPDAPAARLLHPLYLTDQIGSWIDSVNRQAANLDLQWSRFRTLVSVGQNLNALHRGLGPVRDAEASLLVPHEAELDLTTVTSAGIRTETITARLAQTGFQATTTADGKWLRITGLNPAAGLTSIEVQDATGRRQLLSAFDRTRARALPSALRPLQDRLENVFAALERFAGQRRRLVARTVRLLVTLGFLSAAGLHFFSHYIPRPIAAEQTAHTSGHPGADAHAPRHDAPHHVANTAAAHGHFATIQILAGSIALLLAGSALGVFLIARSRRLEEQDHDVRAIAEGLRIQFYWNLAGLGKSVSANYLSRHRSELDWIRSVIRSASGPYHHWKASFSAFDPADQLHVLWSVYWNWLHGQKQYFETKYNLFQHARHQWHHMAGVAVLAGLWTFFRLILSAMVPGLVVVTEWGISRVTVIEAGLAITGVLFVVAIRVLSGSTEAEHHRHRGRADCPWVCRVISSLNPLRWMPVLCDWLVPAPVESTWFRWPLVRTARGVLKVLAHLPAAIALSAVIHGLCRWSAATFPTSPDQSHLEVLCGGLLLLSGAVCVAWSEKNLVSELAYQYNTMALLFRASSLRMRQELQHLEELLVQTRDRAWLPDERNDWNQTVQRIQGLLFELGSEALDENAEWLLLHRSRPMEPLIA